MREIEHKHYAKSRDRSVCRCLTCGPKLFVDDIVDGKGALTAPDLEFNRYRVIE